MNITKGFHSTHSYTITRDCTITYYVYISLSPGSCLFLCIWKCCSSSAKWNATFAGYNIMCKVFVHLPTFMAQNSSRKALKFVLYYIIDYIMDYIIDYPIFVVTITSYCKSIIATGEVFHWAPNCGMCWLWTSHAHMALGSPVSGFQRNVFFSTDCQFLRPLIVIQLGYPKNIFRLRLNNKT